MLSRSFVCDARAVARTGLSLLSRDAERRSVSRSVRSVCLRAALCPRQPSHPPRRHGARGTSRQTDRQALRLAWISLLPLLAAFILLLLCSLRCAARLLRSRIDARAVSRSSTVHGVRALVAEQQVSTTSGSTTSARSASVSSARHNPPRPRSAPGAPATTRPSALASARSAVSAGTSRTLTSRSSTSTTTSIRSCTV